jgi:hypothetical protein
MKRSNWSVLGFVTLLMLAATRPSAAYDYPLGPPQLDRWCKETYARTYKVVQLGPGAGDWVCQSSRTNRPIDVRAACVLFNKSNAQMTQAYYDGRSWQCKWVLTEQKVNLNLYCAQHFGSQYQAILHGTTSYDWSCQRGTNASDRRPISVDTACKEQWPYNVFFKSIAVPNADWRCLLRPTPS